MFQKFENEKNIVSKSCFLFLTTDGFKIDEKIKTTAWFQIIRKSLIYKKTY